jgi:hypothetical protein
VASVHGKDEWAAWFLRLMMVETVRRPLTLEELEGEEALEMPDRVEMSLVPGFVTAPALPTMPLPVAPVGPVEAPPADPAPVPDAPPVQ